jgi:DNA-binding GntR family transcriptional regulator
MADIMLLKREPRTRANGAGVRRDGLYTAIADRLREMIQEGELAPGSRLMEKELCEYFDISKTPLREALKVLVAEGLVTHRQHQGYHIAQIDLAEIESAFEVLHGMEEIAGKALAERLNEEDLAAIERKHQAMVASHANGKRTAYFRINQEIHQMIIDAAHNPILSSIYTGLMTKIHRARGVANADQARWKESLTEHEEIMKALRAPKKDELPRTLREHSERTAHEVLLALRQLKEANGDRLVPAKEKEERATA